MQGRVGGIIQIKVDGETIPAKGDSFTYNTGRPKKEAVKGTDGVHGFKEMIQVPFIEGVTTDLPELAVERLKDTASATVVLLANNGKTIILRDAHYTAEGDTTTEEGEVQLRFEGLSCQVIEPDVAAI